MFPINTWSFTYNHSAHLSVWHSTWSISTPWPLVIEQLGLVEPEDRLEKRIIVGSPTFLPESSISTLSPNSPNSTPLCSPEQSSQPTHEFQANSSSFTIAPFSQLLKLPAIPGCFISASWLVRERDHSIMCALGLSLDPTWRLVMPSV